LTNHAKRAHEEHGVTNGLLAGQEQCEARTEESMGFDFAQYRAVDFPLLGATGATSFQLELKDYA
jgi:hypothetical protein